MVVPLGQTVLPWERSQTDRQTHGTDNITSSTNVSLIALKKIPVCTYEGEKQKTHIKNNTDIIPVFQIKPVLPSEVDKNTSGRTNIGSSPSCRTGFFSWVCQILKFSNRTIIRGDMAIFVKQGKNPVFTLFGTLYRNVRADCILCGRITFESSLSCGRGTILTSLEHWLFHD